MQCQMTIYSTVPDCDLKLNNKTLSASLKFKTCLHFQMPLVCHEIIWEQVTITVMY